MGDGVTLHIAKGQGLLSGLLKAVKDGQANGSISGDYNYNKIVNCNMWEKLKEINDNRRNNGNKVIYRSNNYTCDNRSDKKDANYWHNHMVVYAGDIKLTDDEWNELVKSMGLELTNSSNAEDKQEAELIPGVTITASRAGNNAEPPVVQQQDVQPTPDKPVTSQTQAQVQTTPSQSVTSQAQNTEMSVAQEKQNPAKNATKQTETTPPPASKKEESTPEVALEQKVKEQLGSDADKLDKLDITPSLNNQGEVEYRDRNGNLLDAGNIKNTVNTMAMKQDAAAQQSGNTAMKPETAEPAKPKVTSQPIDNKRTTNFNSKTEVAADAKGVVDQREKMNDEKFDVLTEIPAATQTAEKAIKDSYTDKQSSQASSGNDFANAVLQYKYTGDQKDLDALADLLIESGLSAEELREKYGIKAEFTDESMVDGDKVSQRFKDLLKQEFLGDQKPVKERTMEEMAKSLTNVSVNETNQLNVESNPLEIGLPEVKDIDLKIPEALTPENIEKYKTSINTLRKAPSGENVLDVMEHNREGKKRLIDIPTTLERSVLADLTVDKVKEVKLDEVNNKFDEYSKIKLDGLTGVKKRQAMQQQADLKKDIAQKMGISDNDIDYSRVEIDDLKAVRDTEKLIQDREKAKAAISEVTKSMGDKNFPTTEDIQEKVSFIDENILKEVNTAIPEVEKRVTKANADIARNDEEILRLQALIDDKKKQLTEQARESTDAKSQRNELKKTIAELEQQILNLRLANAQIQENLNMLNAIQTKLKNIQTASSKAKDYLASYKTALDELQAFDKKSAPVEAEKIGKQDNKAQKRFDKHNKKAVKNIASDKVISKNKKKASDKKLDKYNDVEQVKVETDNHKQVEDVQAKFLNKEEQS